jgi:hypothetical protein
MTNFEAILEKGACSSKLHNTANVGRGTNNSQSEDCIQKTKRALKSALGQDNKREGGEEGYVEKKPEIYHVARFQRKGRSESSE